MPELPDVEVIKQYIDATSLHKEITHITVKDDRVLNIAPQTLRKYMTSQSFEATKRTGKHLFLSTDSEKWLALHFGMTGEVTYYEGAKDDVPGHTLLLFRFKNNSQLAYICQRKLGSVDITDHPAQFCKEHDLGPDALQVDLKAFRKLLDGKRGMIKTALMDQNTFAGIGNVYSDEILYQCNIHPETNIKNISDDHIKQLHRNMKRIFKTAINNRTDPEQMPDTYLIGHRQKDAECPDCKGGVQRIEVSGRGCYICPDCQQKR